MDPVTFAFLALIALVSGGAAYFADWLGRKLGKKRLRLGRLRPKHTAAVGVVSSGILISVFTIGLVYACSSDVRQWIREGRLAIRQLNDARRERDAAKAESEKIDALNKTLRSNNQQEIARASETLKSINVKTLKLQGEIAENRIAAQKLQTKLGSVQQEYIASIASLRSTEEQRTKAEMSLASIQTQFGALQSQYHGLKSSYTQLSAQSIEIKNKNLEVTNANISLNSSNLALAAKGRELEAENNKAAELLNTQNTSLINMQSELVAMTTEIRHAEERIQEDKEKEQKLDNSVKYSRERPLIFAAREELARLGLPSRVTKQQVRDAITTLLREARAVAESRGAKGRGASLPAAAIFEHEDAAHNPVSPEQIVDSIAQKISSRPTEQVLVATCSLNAFEGEPVSIDLTAYPNPLVYKRDQVLAETRIDGHGDDEAILSKITDFLRQKVHDRAKNDHLIPTADDSYGNVDGAAILKIVKTVQSADRTVRLQAIARSNTRAGDPLQIELRIR